MEITTTVVASGDAVALAAIAVAPKPLVLEPVDLDLAIDRVAPHAARVPTMIAPHPPCSARAAAERITA